MAKPADLRKAMAGNTRETTSTATEILTIVPADRESRTSPATSHRPSSASYGSSLRSRTPRFRRSSGRLLNDLFAKFGKPEIVPVEE